jgi:hypothetical protein
MEGKNGFNQLDCGLPSVTFLPGRFSGSIRSGLFPSTIQYYLHKHI